MPRHEHFEELCSLAVLGEVSPAELAELTEHLHECDGCQAAYADFIALANDHLSIAGRGLGRSRERGADPATPNLRESTLKRVVAEGLRVSPEAMQGPVDHKSRAAQWFRDLRWSTREHLPQLGLAAVLVVVAAAGSVLVRRDVAQRREMKQLRADLLQAHDAAARLRQKLDQTERTQSDAMSNTVHLQQQLAAARDRAARLEAERDQNANAIRSLEAHVAQLSSDRAALGQRAGATDSELANVRGQLEKVRAAASDKEAQLTAQQYRVAELSDQLNVQKAALEREQQLLAAGRDVRDLMGARNLHIIDVHDRDARGEARPFGRIFLTEGKRLIFYAYDLDTIKVKNASFQAWGQRDGGTGAIVSLGILYVDDQKQSRWALKVEDPNLLKAIDSVFVTVEPPGGTTKPSGKKLMYAYLRNPINHP